MRGGLIDSDEGGENERCCDVADDYWPNRRNASETCCAQISFNRRLKFHNHTRVCQLNRYLEHTSNTSYTKTFKNAINSRLARCAYLFWSYRKAAWCRHDIVTLVTNVLSLNFQQSRAVFA